MNKIFSTDQSNKDSQMVMNYGRSKVRESQTLNVQVYVVTLQKLYRLYVIPSENNKADLFLGISWASNEVLNQYPN